MSNRSLLTSWRSRWHRSLVSFLRGRVRTSVDIEDLAQETYVRLLRNQDLSGVNNPQAYLLRVASHVVTEWRNEQPAAGQWIELTEDELIDSCNFEDDLDAQVTQERLEQILAEATAGMRSVLLLRFRDGYSRKDIAEKLSMSERQVRRYLVRGYEFLRESLEKIERSQLK